MYVKIPDDLREPVIKELRKNRLHACIKYFPLMVVIFSALLALALLVKLHGIVDLVRDLVPERYSDREVLVGALVVILVLTAAVLAFFMRQSYRECECDQCLYCRECDAVDKYDDGCCPVCKAPLTEKGWFFSTTDKGERKILERWGLQATRNA